MADYVAIKAELDADPLARGYAGMTSVQVSDSMNNTIDRSVPADPISGDEMFSLSDNAEFDALSADKKDRWVMFTRSDTIDLQYSSNQNLVNHIFGNPSTTRTALIDRSTVLVSRAVELELGSVKPGHVETARAL